MTRAAESRRRLTIAAAALGSCVLLTATSRAAPPGPLDVPPLPPAQTWTDRGLAPELRGVEADTRVRIVLRSQPLLEAAASKRVQDQIQAEIPTAPADRPTGGIANAEKRVAERAERTYERAVAGLEDESMRAGGQVNRAAAFVAEEGGTVVAKELLPAAVVARADAATIGSLLERKSVQAIEPAPRERPLMDHSVNGVGAPSWWGAGLTGGTGSADQVPADAAVEGEAPDPNHPAFDEVDLDNSPAESPGDHGTHTAGVIASGDDTHRGVAYGLDNLIGANTSAYALGVPGVAGDPAAVDPAEVINRSFGGTGMEDADDGVDVLTTLFGVSRVESAGNTEPPTPSIPTVENVGRNMLSVAAYNDIDTAVVTDDVVLGDSSRGPTPLGRKKPDLIAPGGSIVAPAFGGGFTAMSGTSFSAPHVAGAMTLLEGAGITDEKAQRAILINSARAWSGMNTGLAGWTAPQTGWRPEVGWGALDLDVALTQRDDYVLGAVPEGEAAFYRATVPAGAKATMAFQLRGIWPNFPQGAPGGPMAFTQSNLNLRQYMTTGSEIPPPAAFDPPGTDIDPGPDAVDPNDTVEQVRTPSAQTITYKIESASEIDGADAEPFALASVADLDPLVAPLTRPSNTTASPSAPVACDEPVAISTELVNDSPDLDSSSSAVSLELPTGMQLASGSPVQAVSGGTLEASTTSETKTWTVEATTHGPHSLTVAGAGHGLGTPFRRTQSVDVTSDCVPPETMIDAGPSAATNDATPTFMFSASGGASGFECSADGGAFAPCESGLVLGPFADGAHTFAVRAIDAVGNADPSPSSRSFLVDTAPPQTTITEALPVGSSGSGRSFRFAASEQSASFTCSLDGAAASPCASPSVYTSLRDGAHAFAVRATDAAGNADPSPATMPFEVDGRLEGVKLRARPRQPMRRPFGIRLSVGAETDATVRVSGRLDGTKLRLDANRFRLQAGGMRSLKIGAPRRTVRRARETLGAGDPVRLLIRVRLADAAGNSESRTVKVRVI